MPLFNEAAAQLEWQQDWRVVASEVK